MSKVVSELKYSAEHEWVAADGAGPVGIGISAVAADALGDIVYVDLPEVAPRSRPAKPAARWNPPSPSPTCTRR